MVTRTSPDMLLLAHRGCHVNVPENTLEAFEAAAKLKVDGIETDVRWSADGALVLLHERVTPQGHPVAMMTRAELEKAFGHDVPVLTDALDAFPALLWNIEIKDPAATETMLAVLTRYQGSRRLLVTSFRHEVVIQCASRLVVDCGLLFAHRPLDIATIIASCARYPRIACLVWDYNAVDNKILAAVNAARWKNYVYGVATTSEHERCRALGCVGVITDFPWLMSGDLAPPRDGISTVS
jgi:glycerophosphoryl diester phosphodiesterase